MIDPTHRFASVVLGTTDLGTDTLRALRRRADAVVQNHLGGSLELRFVGDYWEITRGNEVMARDQIMMTLSSFALIFLFVGLLLRSWKLTLLCIPPNVLPLLGALGFMGICGLRAADRHLDHPPRVPRNRRRQHDASPHPDA